MLAWVWEASGRPACVGLLVDRAPLLSVEAPHLNQAAAVS